MKLLLFIASIVLIANTIQCQGPRDLTTPTEGNSFSMCSRCYRMLHTLVSTTRPYTTMCASGKPLKKKDALLCTKFRKYGTGIDLSAFCTRICRPAATKSLIQD